MKKNKNEVLYGFGTHRLKGIECYKSVLYALKAGYNLIDTAEKYYNDVEIGRAIKKSRKKRENIKVIHKLTDVLEFNRTKDETYKKVTQYLKNLQLGYIDILLMHGPSPRYHEQPEIFKEGNIQVWEAMAELKAMGLVKSIGVSNFNKEQIMYLIEATGIIPEYLEVEFNVINYKEANVLKTWTDRMGIKTIAYSPIAAGGIEAISKTPEYEKVHNANVEITPGEFALRFCLKNNTIPIPRSSNPKRIKLNLRYLKKGAI